MPTIRGPNHNHPAVRFDRAQRLVAAALKRRVVIAFALAALALRLATLTWGAGLGPFEGIYHPDEWSVWGSAQNFPANYLTNTNFSHGTALQYAVGALLIPVKALWQSGEPLVQGMDYAQFVLISVRVVHALLGALAVLLVYRLGRMIFDRSTGLVAAAFLAVSFYHVLTSAFTTLDVPASFFVTLTLVLAARAARSGKRSDFAWLGIAAGLLLGTRITGALVFVAVAVLIVCQLLPGRPTQDATSDDHAADADVVPPATRGALLTGMVLAAAVAFAVFAVAMPHAVLDPHALLGGIAARATAARHSVAAPFGVAGSGVHAMRVAMTTAIAVLTTAGLIAAPFFASRSFRGLHWATLAFLVAYVLFWAGSLSPRQMVPIVPLLCIYGALPIGLLFRAPWAMVRRIGALVATIVAGYSLYQTLLGIEHRRSDSRSLAAAYIATQLPRGATVALAPTTDRDPWTTHPWRYPKLPPGSFELVSMLDEPQFIITTSYALDNVSDALRSGELGPDRVWSDSLAHWWYNSLFPAPEEFRFHQSLLDGSGGYVLERRWPKTARVPLEFPAPEIRLYRLARDGEELVPSRSASPYRATRSGD